jgi:hypothetical protein
LCDCTPREFYWTNLSITFHRKPKIHSNIFFGVLQFFFLWNQTSLNAYKIMQIGMDMPSQSYYESKRRKLIDAPGHSEPLFLPKLKLQLLYLQKIFPKIDIYSKIICQKFYLKIRCILGIQRINFWPKSECFNSYIQSRFSFLHAKTERVWYRNFAQYF